MKYAASAIAYITGVGAFVLLFIEGHAVAGWIIYFFSMMVALLIMTHDAIARPR